MFKGTALVISRDEREREDFSNIFGFLEWAQIPAASVPEVLRTLMTVNVDLLVLSENAVGMSLLTGLRVLCEVAPNLPVALVLPDDRLEGLGSLPAAGLLRRSATVGEVKDLIEASRQMQPARRAAVRPGAHPPSGRSVRMGVRHVEGAAVVAPEDRLDLTGYADLEEKLEHLAEAGHRRIVLDLASVTMLSSACFATLMRFWAEFQGRGGHLAVARPTKRAAASIRACNLDRIIPVFESLEDALACVRGRRKTPTGRWPKLEG